MKRVLNVGGNSKLISLPPQYAEFEHVLLDIDPRGSPDIVCDARRLSMLEGNDFDAVYCSHNLEHYYEHEVGAVLAGFLHVLKDGGFAHIRVPDLQEVFRRVVDDDMDVQDVLYSSSAGPIKVLDVIYGYGPEIARSGQEFYAHKTGFSEKSLQAALHQVGFTKTFSALGSLEINALAFKGLPNESARVLFNLDA